MNARSRLGAAIKGVKPAPVIGVVLVLCVLAVVVAPIGTELYASLWSATFIHQPGSWSLINYINVLTAGGSLPLLWNTLEMTFGATALAMVVGAALAWLVARTDVPFKPLIRWLPVCSLFLTALLRDIGWIELYSPRTGLVNIGLEHLLGIHTAVFNIYSMEGMIASIGFNLVPIPYFILLGPLSAMNGHLEEASRTSGAGTWKTLVRVTIPQLRPAMLSAFALTAVVVASSFETPVIIGLPAGIRTYMSAIYTSMNGGATPMYDLAAAQSATYLVFTVLLLVWYTRTTRIEKRFVLVSGRGQSREVIRLGGWRWVALAFVLLEFVVSFLQLVVVTVMVSLVAFYTVTQGFPFEHLTMTNYSSVLSTPGTLSAIEHSFYVGAAVAACTVLVALLLSVVSFKTRIRGRRLAEVVGTLPIAMPPLVFSVALLMTVLTIPGVLSLYNTVTLLVIAEVVVFLPYALRIVSSSMVSIGDELFEASAASGAGMFRTLRSIVVPIVGPSLINAGAITFILSLRELGAVILIVPLNFSVMPNQIFSIWQTGDFGEVNAFNVVSVIAMLVVLVIGLVIFGIAARGYGRFRIGHQSGAL